MLILYFSANLIHYFYNSKTRGDRKKRTPDSESLSKNTQLNGSEKNRAINTTLIMTHHLTDTYAMSKVKISIIHTIG